jgi:membrane-bound serine protease (ClpP class)
MEESTMCHLILFLPFFAVPLFWIFPFETALSLYLLVLGISLLLYFKIFQAMRQKVKTGQEAMLGKKGLVVEDIDPEGKIQYANEIWDATARGCCFVRGEHVKIREIRGLVLQVEEMPGEA